MAADRWIVREGRGKEARGTGITWALKWRADDTYLPDAPLYTQPWPKDRKLAQRFKTLRRALRVRKDAGWTKAAMAVVRLRQRGVALPESAFAVPTNCRDCGAPLLLQNLHVDDGCPCNAARGVNVEPSPCRLCDRDDCVKPAHRLLATAARPVPEVVKACSDCAELRYLLAAVLRGEDTLTDRKWKRRARVAMGDE